MKDTRFIGRAIGYAGILWMLAAGATQARHGPNQFPTSDDAPLRFDRLTVDDGLSQQSVYTILQDRHGFMWFGTQNGVNRYDGYAFKTYIHDPADPDGLGRGRSFRLLEDRRGFLWIGHTRDRYGLDRYEPATDTFTHFQHDPDDSTSISANWIYTLYEDREGVLWAGANVLNRFDPETNTFTRILPDCESGDSSRIVDNVYAIAEDRDRALWLGTDQGLFRYDRSSETFVQYRHDDADPATLSHDRITALYVDRNGILWAGAHALNRFDPETKTFQRYDVDLAAREAGEEGPGNGSFRGAHRITSILEDHRGILWVGTGGDPTLGMPGGSGVYRFDPEYETFIRYEHDPADPYSLSHNDIQSIYEYRQGVLWVGTAGGGVNRVDRTVKRFTLYGKNPAGSAGLQGDISMALFQDRDDVLWVGTWNGILKRMDRRTGKVTVYRHDPLDPVSLGPGGISAVHRDREGRLWVGTEQGLQRLDEDLGSFVTYRHDPADPTSIGDDRINRIFEANDGTLWIGTYAGGIHRFDPAAETFTRYVHDQSNSTGLSGNWIASIFEDREGVIWVGTEKGLSRYEAASDTFSPYLPETLGGFGIYSIYEHPEHPGTLWVGTGGGGLYRLDTRAELAALISAYNSDLPDNMIYCVLGDEEGNIWASTNRGLARFDMDAESWKNFGMDSGAQGLEYDIYACHHGYNGELFFGGINGVNAIRPADAFANSNPPQVALSGMRLFNEPVVPGPDAPIRTSITEAGALTLKHHQNDLGLGYVGLHFRHPERNRYAYKLDGYDDAWREVGTDRWANYTNLSPGDYVFRVTASNSDGVWNEEGASLSITILPPWWLTWWAYILYGLAFLGSVLALERVQRRRLIARERLRAEREKAKAIESTNNELQRALKPLTEVQDQLIHTEKMASLGQLTAGIAHEIKNPLNFVNNFAQINAELLHELLNELTRNPDSCIPDSRIGDIQQIIEDLRLNEDKITAHGRRADGIIRSMLEHSRTGRGERREVDINKLADEYANLAYHGMRARNGEFEVVLERDYDDAIGKMKVFPQEIGRVLINLLDNAFYAVKEKAAISDSAYIPCVHLKTVFGGSWIEIRVSDNGVGISHEIRDKIFEPFFTTKPTGSGTGLGLSLSYDIVAQGHGGSLTVESEEGKGAVFIVRLPV